VLGSPTDGVGVRGEVTCQQDVGQGRPVVFERGGEGGWGEHTKEPREK
jgi:hypothetical protein